MSAIEASILLYSNQPGLTGTIPTQVSFQLVVIVCRSTTHVSAYSHSLYYDPSVPPPSLQFGLLTSVTAFSLEDNDLTGPVPSECGQMVEMSSGFNLASNFLSSTIPTGESIKARDRLDSHGLCLMVHHVRACRSPSRITESVRGHRRLGAH